MGTKRGEKKVSKRMRIVAGCCLMWAATGVYAPNLQAGSATVFVPGNALGAFGHPSTGSVHFVRALAVSGPGMITITYLSGTVTDCCGINTGPDGVSWTVGTDQTPLQEALGVSGGTVDNLDALIAVFVPEATVTAAGFKAVDGTKDLVPAGIVPASLFFVGSQPMTFCVRIAGTLYLGINDYIDVDNGGGYTVMVTGP